MENYLRRDDEGHFRDVSGLFLLGLFRYPFRGYFQATYPSKDKDKGYFKDFQGLGSGYRILGDF